MLSVVFSRGFSEIVRNKENGDIGAWFLRPTMVIVNTILLGFIPAVICCLITKYYESLRSNAIHEILFVVFFGFIFVSLSGLQIIPNSITISLLMFGTIQSYYTRYNLSNFAQEKITAVFCMFSQLCKISLFLFGGVSFVFCFQHDVLLVVSLILGVNIVVRAITMLFVIFLGKVFCRIYTKHKPIEYVIIYFVKMVKGPLYMIACCSIIMKGSITNGEA